MSAKVDVYKLYQERYAKARNHIATSILGSVSPTADIDISDAYDYSRILLGDYVTLDWKHRMDIQRILSTIRNYAKDATLRRPLNIMMQAEPGSGKSHMVKCLARKLESRRAAAVDFNMASLHTIEDLTQPLDAARNLKVLDRLPILFLDEFDSNPANYAMLLPLMWDGELHVGHRDLKLGKLVIILAGSSSNIEKTMRAAKGMRAVTEVPDTKLVDLLSRINGGELAIPPLDAITDQRDRRVDKVCITASLLQGRFAGQLECVPWALLRFVMLSSFRYGVRSIAHLVDLVTPPEDNSKSLTLESLNLSLRSVDALRNSSLAYHVYSEDGPAAIVDLWTACRRCSVSVRISKAEEEEVPF